MFPQPQARWSLTEAQKVAARTYCEGEFSHFAEITNEDQLDQALAECGDGVFRGIMRELDGREDCTDDNALDRLSKIVTEIEIVRMSIALN